MSRSRTRERRMQREKEQRRQRQIAIAVVLVGVAVLAVIGIILANQPTEATIPQDVIDLYTGIPQSETVEGFHILGNPDAPVEVVEYSSFDCTHCRDFHDEVTPALIQRVRAGEISFTYVPLYGTGGISNGQGAARTAICAGEQGQFWPMHSVLFEWQGLYANTAFSGNRLATGAENLGINRAQWDQCFNSAETQRILDAAVAKANSINGFSGTPFVTVNGTAVTPEINAINTAIDQGLASASAPIVPLGELTPEATSEATEEPVAEAATAEATADSAAESTPESTEAATAEAGS